MLVNADAVAIPLRGASVDLVVTSPPYFGGMRDYDSDGQIGAEREPSEYIGSLMNAMEEMGRVLKPRGSVFIIIGDKYARTGGVDRKARGDGSDPGGRAHRRLPQKGVRGVPDKSLVGIPSRLALAALDSGWLWRQEIIWVKSNPLPESVKDRCQRAHETVLHFTRDKKYHAEPGGDLGSHDVWIIPVSRRRFPDGMKHPAVFPEAIPERIIRGYCPLGGVVFDPFVGSGTTVRVANRLGRHGIGADLNIEYLRGAQSA